MFWSKKKVLVTGSEGLMGKPMCEALEEQGAEVTRVDLVLGHDIRKPGLVRNTMAGHDVCIHLAALSNVEESRKSVPLVWQVNIEGTWNVLQAASEWQIPATLVASSNHVYGPQDTYPADETAPLNQLDTYSITKICSDYLARAYAHNYDLAVAVIRNTNCFGPRDVHSSHIVPGTIQTILDGQPPVIRGSGATKKGYLYVEDVVFAYLLVAEQLYTKKIAHGEAFNVGAPPISVWDLVATIQVIMDDGLIPEVLHTSNDQTDEDLDSSKIRALGWKAKYNLRDGLQKTVDWFREQQKIKVAV